jgi:hypothetical protein
VHTRYASRYTTEDGTLPPHPTLDDVFQEDLTAIQLVDDYVANGERCLVQLSRMQRLFRPDLYRAAKMQEQAEAEKLARLVFSEGQPLIAALVRVAHTLNEPALTPRRNRLIEITVSATTHFSIPVPPYNYL